MYRERESIEVRRAEYYNTLFREQDNTLVIFPNYLESSHLKF